MGEHSAAAVVVALASLAAEGLVDHDAESARLVSSR